MRNYTVETGDHKPIFYWTNGVSVEEGAREQLRNVASMPFIHDHIAVMPDVHIGKGATIGSVIPTSGAVIPAAVGVDIGCGMLAVQTTLCVDDLRGREAELRKAIEKAVPHGRSDHGGKNDVGSWRGDIPTSIGEVWRSVLWDGFETAAKAYPAVLESNSVSHLGTLGTGNHFIEVSKDESGRIWILIHSGSRGVGNKLAQHYMCLAKAMTERWYTILPDKDLAFFPEGEKAYSDYLFAVRWSQRFATENRNLMLAAVLEVLSELGMSTTPNGEVIDCPHNFVDTENHYGKNVLVTRKGAVRVREGHLGIIPGSMGAKSFIVKGKGSYESFYSCSHGAGRAMSRTAARKRFSVEDHIAATIGVECRKDEGVLDETPAAYKNIQSVVDAQSDLVSVEHVLKQIVCVKG